MFRLLSTSCSMVFKRTHIYYLRVLLLFTVFLQCAINGRYGSLFQLVGGYFCLIIGYTYRYIYTPLSAICYKALLFLFVMVYERPSHWHCLFTVVPITTKSHVWFIGSPVSIFEVSRVKSHPSAVKTTIFLPIYHSGDTEEIKRGINSPRFELLP